MKKNILLEIRDLNVEINQEKIINNLNFKLESGEICALVGHNGAGKTVTMKTVMGIQKKNSGIITLNNYCIDSDYYNYKSQFSYIPEEPLLFMELTVFEHFQLYGKSYNVPPELFEKRVEYYVNGLELNGKLNNYLDDLSKGMRQKVNIICSLITDAPLLIVDEPFIGLDENASLFLENQLIDKARKGTSILLTSHVIERIKKFCNSFIMLKNGQIIQQGKINNLEGIERRI